MEETEFIWMDGQLINWKDAKVHFLTHSLHYGSGVFEGIRVYETEKGAAIFRLKEHIERLFNSAKSIRMTIPFTEEQIFNAIVDLVRKNNLKSGYVRPLAYFGYGKMGLGVKGAPVNVGIACWPWGSYLGEKPIKVKISPFMRIHPKTSIMGAKISGHYVNSILASEDAKDSGYEESLLLDYQGNIAEGPGENFFIVKGEMILTPILGNILPGITRDSIIKIAQDLGYKVREIPMTQSNLSEADEAFFTGTAAEVTPIASIDNKKMKSHEVSFKIKEVYHNAITGKDKNYQDWLTYVN